MKTQVMTAQGHYAQVKAIVNIGKRQRTTSEESVLKKSLKFATTMKRIPYLDLIAPIEEAALNIPKSQANEIKWRMRKAVKKSKYPKPNISNEERLVLKS